MTQKPREGAKADRAASIKAAAIEVFASHGYHATKVSMIVKKVGVAQGTFYLYYKSKQEIFDEILGDFLGLFSTSVEEWEVGTFETVEALREGLVALGEILLRVLVENRDLTRIFFKEALINHPEFTARIETFYSDLTDVMTGINRLNHQLGLIREQNFRVLAYCTMGMAERNIQQYIVEPEDPPPIEVMRDIVVTIVDLFLYGASQKT
jgi:TetR/AcrR family fatty acid metabolism transcriptional regulator